MLIAIALTGHVMALFWFLAEYYEIKICSVQIYALPIGKKQIQRELRNSLHVPIHSILLLACLGLGLFKDTGHASFVISLVLTFVWSEIWHYVSHRLFHLKQLHWIHKEHHRFWNG
jgi:sterol desaturase/sphingolipid hydroxylase (fatty acid hydroxylase superfamily)